ncbi:hypothetical protein [Pedobacter nyackensis]|uniref:hypothetical protein n=1 Tax=Pedobacter nyackensis TaxID=475255 RepID=UPI00293021F0|nr:hypothetical protein [Pedobacter nyackensis]
MIKYFVQPTGVFFLVVLLFACSSTNNKPLLIGFSADSSAIVFNDIDQAGLLQLQNLEGNDTTLNSLVSVLQTPSERDSTIKESPVDGKILVTDSCIVFTPSVPFLKGRDYLVITHLNTRFGSIKDLLKDEVVNRVRPQQQLLTR